MHPGNLGEAKQHLEQPQRADLGLPTQYHERWVMNVVFRACIQIFENALPFDWIRGIQRDPMEDIPEMPLSQSAHRYNLHAILGIKRGCLGCRESLDSLSTKIVDFSTHLHARLFVRDGLNVRDDAIRSIKGYASKRCRQIIENLLELSRGSRESKEATSSCDPLGDRDRSCERCVTGIPWLGAQTPGGTIMC